MTLDADDAVEHARVVGPLRRAARQGVRRRRSAAAVHDAVPGHRSALPADQHRLVRGHVPAHVPRAEERRLLDQQRPDPDDGPALREARRRVPRLPVLPAGRGQLERSVRVQQRVHAARSAEQHRRRSGNGFATFLLGLPTSGSVQLGTPRTERYRVLRASTCRTTGSSARAPRSTSACAGITSRP